MEAVLTPSLALDRWSLQGVAASGVPHGHSPQERLVQALMQQPDHEDIAAVLADTASLLCQVSGWRWAVIARLTDGGRSAQVLAWVDRGRRLGGWTYELALTPCSTLVQAEGVCHYDRFGERFMHESGLRALGVTHYAGLVCRRADQAVGHVFLMHDEALSEEAARRVDGLLQLACVHVGAQFELHGVRSILRDTQRRAETDSLTQLPNRHAFEREVSLQISLVTERARPDSLLAIFDVNGLKLVNDSRGHLAGDELLKQIAQLLRTQLRRHQDEVFRIGGDEFALITDHPKPGCEDWLRERAAHVVAVLQEGGFPEAGLSIGVARLRETNGGRSQWLALADARMYAHKGTRRRASDWVAA